MGTEKEIWEIGEAVEVTTPSAVPSVAKVLIKDQERIRTGNKNDTFTSMLRPEKNGLVLTVTRAGFDSHKLLLCIRWYKEDISSTPNLCYGM